MLQGWTEKPLAIAKTSFALFSGHMGALKRRERCVRADDLYGGEVHKSRFIMHGRTYKICRG